MIHQNLDYTVLNGARRQEGRWDPTENEQVAPEGSFFHDLNNHRLVSRLLNKLLHNLSLSNQELLNIKKLNTFRNCLTQYVRLF